MNATAQVEDTLLDELRIHCIDFEDSGIDPADSIPGLPLAEPPPPAVTQACPTELLDELRDWAGQRTAPATSPRPPELARSRLSPSVEQMLRAYVGKSDDLVETLPGPVPSVQRRAAATRANIVGLTAADDSEALVRRPPMRLEHTSPWLHKDLVALKLRELRAQSEAPDWQAIHEALGLTRSA